MSYGSGRERKERLKVMKEITADNVKRFLELSAEQFSGDYPGIINDRAAERETQIDKDFLSAVASKNLGNAFSAFQRDVNNLTLTEVLQKIVRENMAINYSDIPEIMQSYLRGPEARGVFFNAARAGVRRILQAPIQL